MKTSVILSVLLTAVAAKILSSPDTQPGNKHNKHSFVNDADWQNGLVSYDENGNPFVRCAYSDGVLGAKLSKKCQLPKDATSDMGVACYSLWHGDHLTQDCWIHQDISLQQCTPRKCESSASTFGVNFCCCFGHECNNDYTVTE